MKNIIKKSRIALLLFICISFTACDEKVRFSEERLVGKWKSEFEVAMGYSENILTFNEQGRWTLSIRTEDLIGNVSYKTDAGYYDVITNQLYLESYRYNDIQVYDVQMKGNKLILSGGENKTIYNRILFPKKVSFTFINEE